MPSFLAVKLAMCILCLCCKPDHERSGHIQNSVMSEKPPSIPDEFVKPLNIQPGEPVSRVLVSSPSREAPQFRLSNRWKMISIPAKVLGHLVSAPLRRLMTPRARASWTPSFETYVTALRSALIDAPEDIETSRMFADLAVPGMMLPKGVYRFKERVLVTGDHRIKCEWLWPQSLTPETRFRRLINTLPDSFLSGIKTRPILFYVHGGAFSLCSTGSHRGLLMSLAMNLEMPVFAPNYRRPPEVSLEVTISDVLVALDRLTAYGIDISDVVMCGDSAGGNLVIQAILELKKRRAKLPRCAVLLSPWMDLSASGDEELAQYDYLPINRIEFFAKIAAGEGRALNDPSVSPSYADLSGLPPTLVHAGECEVLLSSIKKFAVTAENQGVNIEFKIWQDMVHAFHTFFFCHDTPMAAIKDIKGFITRNFDKDLQNALKT